MTEDKRRVVNQINKASTGDRAENRSKTYEDELLKRIQQDTLRESLADSMQGESKLSREHYENNLLEKVMATLTGDDAPKNKQSEMLMITSAVPLTEAEKEAIVRKFMAKTKKNLRRVTTVVDPNMMTGVRLQSESFYYEVSGQKTLRELKRHLDSNWHL